MHITSSYTSTPRFSSTRTTQLNILLAVLRGLEMPLHHLLVDALTLNLNDISVARNHALEIPLGHPGCALIERLAVRSTSSVPKEALLPCRLALCVLQGCEEVGEEALVGWDSALGHLLGGRQVEDQIGFNHSLGGLVIEDDLVVGVCRDVLHVEFAVELLRDAQLWVVGLAEESPRSLGDLEVSLLVSVGWEGLGGDDAGVGEGLVPGLKEDVVFLVEGSDVLDLAVAHAGDFGFDVVGQSDGREDGEVAGLELDDGAAAANADATEAEEGSGHGEDVWSDSANHHDLVGIRRDQFRGA